MADACGISYDILAWTTEWYVREDTLRAAKKGGDANGATRAALTSAKGHNGAGDDGERPDHDEHIRQEARRRLRVRETRDHERHARADLKQRDDDDDGEQPSRRAPQDRETEDEVDHHRDDPEDRDLAGDHLKGREDRGDREEAGCDEAVSLGRRLAGTCRGDGCHDGAFSFSVPSASARERLRTVNRVPRCRHQWPAAPVPRSRADRTYAALASPSRWPPTSRGTAAAGFTGRDSGQPPEDAVGDTLVEPPRHAHDDSRDGATPTPS